MRFTLTTEKLRRRPTWLGWLLIATLFSGLFWGFLHNLYPFLAPEKTPHKGVMIIEGWIHDFALDEAITRFNAGNYSKIVCTGVQIETGSYIQQFKSYPEMTAARLKKMGVPEEKIIISTADDAPKDRTYLAAVALREAIMTYNIKEKNLHLITTGPHGRRSRLLFRKALGKEYNIGITCLDDMGYEPEEWYTYSEGVRAVLSELIAYTYAKLLFHP